MHREASMKIRIGLSFLGVLSMIAVAGAADVVACVGNSITQFGYPQDLQTLMGAAYQVRDYGRSGMCALGIPSVGDSSYMKTPEFGQARSSSPKIVVIMLGTNDSKDHHWVYKANYGKDLTTIAMSFLSLASKPTVWLCHPLPAYQNDLGIRGDVIKDEIIPIIDSIATKNDIPVIDCYTPFLAHPDYQPDGVHPSKGAAQEFLAQIIHDAITVAVVVPRLVPAGLSTNSAAGAVRPRLVQGSNALADAARQDMLGRNAAENAGMQIMVVPSDDRQTTPGK